MPPKLGLAIHEECWKIILRKASWWSHSSINHGLLALRTSPPGGRHENSQHGQRRGLRTLAVLAGSEKAFGQSTTAPTPFDRVNFAEP
jgi:hypothetical protein